MSRPIRITLATTVLIILAIATSLATISGAVQAIDWASRTFGSVAVYVITAFVAGCVVTHSIHRGLAPSAPSSTSGIDRSGGVGSDIDGR